MKITAGDLSGFVDRWMQDGQAKAVLGYVACLRRHSYQRSFTARRARDG